MEKFEFPKGFLWGAATSAHQVEGNNHNDWSEWEHTNAERLAASVKRGQFPDFLLNAFPLPLDPQNYISGRACDHYNRFREDFDIAKSLGHNAYRFSIEWSRIEPEEGKWDENEVQHYQEVIDALHERGIEPLVTLWHWTLPLWVAKQGGWENKKTIADFVRYCEKVTSSLRKVKFWITLNEPEIYALNGYLKGIWPPQQKSILRYIVVLQNLIAAHKKTYEIIHSNILKNVGMLVEVGIAKNNIYLEGRHALILRWWWNFYFLNCIKRHQDFIGMNYYFHKKLLLLAKGKSPDKNLGTVVYSDMSWEIYPGGMYHVLGELKKYNKPIYITENGLADAADTRRATFIREHIQWTARAMKEGANVRGYLHWSLMDNFEWDKGFWPRFGLIEVNYETMERSVRPSAEEYKKIIASNSIEL